MRVTVMGLGLFGGGEGAARHFASQSNVKVTLTDLRDEDALRPALEALSGLPIRCVLGRHEEADFKGCDVLVVNPAVKPGNRYVELARRAGARVATELELGLERAAERSARVLAVTGTNGKTTTATMLASILSAADPRTRSGGNLGGSLLEAAGGLPEGAPLVLEVSSFQLHRLRSFPGLEVAVVTNLSPNHIDWHGSLEAYYAAKRRLLELLPPCGKAVLNADDAALREWGEPLAGRVVSFSRESAAEQVLSSIGAAELHGPHDIENALAAVAAARAFGADAEAIATGLREYRPLGHRLEVVARAGDLVFVNDSASTTPESTVRALESVEGPVVLIAGGHDKGLDFTGLARTILERDIPAVLLGDAGELLAAEIMAMTLNAEWSGEALGKPGGETVIEVAADFDEAVRRAVALSEGRGTVLLSPAASSFDEFRNYVERGRRFADTARRLAGEDAGPLCGADDAAACGRQDDAGR